MLACATALAAGASESPPAAEAFFRSPVLSAAALSPDGRLVAFRIGAKGVRDRLGVLDLQTMKPTVVASFKDADVGHFEWVNDKRLVFDLGTELDAPGYIKMASGLFAVNHDGSNFRQWVETLVGRVKDGNADSRTRMLPWKTYLHGAVGKRNTDEVLVWQPQEWGHKKLDYIELQRLDTITGRIREVDAPLHSFEWIMDPSGELRATVTRENDTEAVHCRYPPT
jgi:hypothetical protein